jgi:cellulose synthase (UDP-forming)
MFLVICCLGVVWERRQLRRSHRYVTREDVTLRDPATGEVLPATLQDLSTSGLGLAVSCRTAPGSGRYVLQARDSYGNRYELPVEVLRVRELGGGRMALGCRFDMADEETRRQVIGFIYGDSGRWKYFAEHRNVAGIGTIRSFFNLVRTGLKGSGRNLAGLAKMAGERLRPAGLK